jgi:hypothetical protein
MEFNEINKLLSPKALSLEMGVQRLPSGILHVASRSEMTGCKGKMLDFWFGFLENMDHYRWWHPGDHKGLQWDDKWSRGNYIGATCTVDETLSGSDTCYRLHIKFHAPEDIFDARELEAAYASGQVSGLVCATIGLGDDPVMNDKGEMIGGRFIHAAYDTPTGCALRNRFWLGWGVDAPAEALGEMIPDQMGVDLMQHANEEYTRLSKFLPSLYHGERFESEADLGISWRPKA